MEEVQGYLVLTRNVGKSIMIGNDIEMRVLSVYGKHVRLGIIAPKSVNIVRKELLERPREGYGDVE